MGANHEVNSVIDNGIGKTKFLSSIGISKAVVLQWNN